MIRVAEALSAPIIRTSLLRALSSYTHNPCLLDAFLFFLLFHILMSDWIIAQVDGECIRTADEGFCPKCAVSLETLDFTTSYTSVHRLELKLCPPSISTGATGCAAKSPQVQWDMLQEPLHRIRYHKASQLCACFWLRFLLCVCVCVCERRECGMKDKLRLILLRRKHEISKPAVDSNAYTYI